MIHELLPQVNAIYIIHQQIYHVVVHESKPIIGGYSAVHLESSCLTRFQCFHNIS